MRKQRELGKGRMKRVENAAGVVVVVAGDDDEKEEEEAVVLNPLCCRGTKWTWDRCMGMPRRRVVALLRHFRFRFRFRRQNAEHPPAEKRGERKRLRRSMERRLNPSRFRCHRFRFHHVTQAVDCRVFCSPSPAAS